MNKVLGIAIFMLTLLPILDIGDASSLSAQNLAYENGSYWFPDINVNGNHKIKCDCCKESFDDQEAFDKHLEHNYNCRNYYGLKDDDDDNNGDGSGGDGGSGGFGFGGKDYCAYCGKPYGTCSCQGVVIPGNNGSSWLWDIEFGVPSPDPSDDVGHASGTGAPSATSSHYCPCLVTTVRKQAVTNITSSNLSAKNKKTGFSAGKIAESLKKTIQFPETIRQGKYGTCGAALMEKELATYHPYLFRECIESLVNTGQYQKWGLTLPAGCDIKSMTDREAEDKGLSVTDVIFQTAFATWAGNNQYLEKARNRFNKSYIFTPKTAGKKNGGVSTKDIKIFMSEVLKLSESEAESAGFDYISKSNRIDYDTHTYTYLISTNCKPNTKQAEFSKEGESHWIEVTNIDKEGVHVWSWGQEFIVKNVEGDLYVRRRKTPEVKTDEDKRKSLTCKCSSCKDIGCSQCK